MVVSFSWITTRADEPLRRNRGSHSRLGTDETKIVRRSVQAVPFRALEVIAGLVRVNDCCLKIGQERPSSGSDSVEPFVEGVEVFVGGHFVESFVCWGQLFARRSARSRF